MEWIRRRAKVVGVDEDIAIRAGELKKRLRIALPDCYVIALAEVIEAKPVFRMVRRKIEPVLDELKRLG